MKKYIFLNVPATGHVNPTLPIVQELVQRGEQVIYYLTEEFRAAVGATGAIFRPYESFLGGIGPGPMPLKMVEESRRVLPQVLESIRAEQPDVLLYEAMCLWGHIAAQVLQVQAVVLRSSYALNEHTGLFAARSNASMPFPSELLRHFQASSAELTAIYHLPPFDLRQWFTHAEDLNIVFLPHIFQPAGETFDERFVFVGPSLLPRQGAPAFPWERLGDQPVLYISLGTAFNHRPDFFRLCFQAFGELPSPVVLAHGKRLDPAELGPAPANFLLAPSVPQLEVLQRTSVFITHGGMNSTMESLYFGVPLIVIPQMMEQEMTARRVEELGLGVALTQKNVTMEDLREAVAHVQHDPSIAQHVQAMHQQVHAAGGYQRATDAILDFAYR